MVTFAFSRFVVSPPPMRKVHSLVDHGEWGKAPRVVSFQTWMKAD